MPQSQKNFVYLLLSHLLIGALLYQFPEFSRVYTLLILAISIFCIVRNKNRNHEALCAAAYIVGSEVFLRMNEGNPTYEFGKYSVICFSILGIYYSGFVKKALTYLIFILLLVPGILIAFNILEEPKLPKIVFDISGPVCLAVASIYTFRKKITQAALDNILLWMSLPILSCCFYLFLYCPDVNKVRFSTESSFALSGDFGPNQVAITLGLGMFLFFYRLVMRSESMLETAINLIITTSICYRGILTFSRGGMLVGVMMMIGFAVLIYLNRKKYKPFYFKSKITAVMISFLAVILVISYQSKGFITKRYTNKDFYGNERREKAYGRQNLAKTDINTFKKAPFLGIGTAVAKQVRTKTLNMKVSSHNEISRLLSEHGIFGFAALMLLFAMPFSLFLREKQYIFRLVFLTFWLLTVSHSGMRIAAPSFLYALALLHIKWKSEELQPTHFGNSTLLP